MISDEIDVITKSASDAKARNISIRSINGRYLIRLIDPVDSSVPDLIKGHGTRIQLKVRVGVPLPELKEIAELWIVFPGCQITVQVDRGLKSAIGYESPKLALEDAITKAGFTVSEAEPEEYTGTFRVVEHQKNGVAIAFALQWSHYYRSWGFATAERLAMAGRQPNETQLATAVCVHGVRVENNSPGFAGQSILAISNVSGLQAPATNVARSSLEAGALLDEMLSNIYACYGDHIATEIKNMETNRGFSISRAASEGRYLLWPLQNTRLSGLSPNAELLLKIVLRRIPFLTLDKLEQRTLISVEQLDKSKGFWTIEGGAYKSTEEFIRRMPTGVSLANVASLGGNTMSLPDGDIVSGHADNPSVGDLLDEIFEVDAVDIQRVQNQASLHWRPLSSTAPIWRSLLPRGRERQRTIQTLRLFRSFVGGSQTGTGLLLQQSTDLRVVGLSGECGLRAGARVYLFDGNEIHQYITGRLAAVESGAASPESFAFDVIALSRLALGEQGAENLPRLLEQLREAVRANTRGEILIAPDLVATLQNRQYRLFDSTRGERSGSPFANWESPWV